MADIKVNELPTATPALTDKLFGIGASEEYQAEISGVANVVLKNYSNSSLETTSKNVVGAINELNDTTNRLEETTNEILTGANEVISEATTNWLDENVTPTGSAVAVDSSLGIAGAAADSKTVGDRFDTMEQTIEDSTATDTTLSVSGKPADAKATGDELSDLKSDLGDVANATYDGKRAVITSLNKGYISGTGTIINPSSNNEVYTDKIPVTEGEVLTVDLQLKTSTNTIWLAYATYSSSETFISRPSLDTASVGSTTISITIPSGVSYIVFTFRTYDGASFVVTKTWELMAGLRNDVDSLEAEKLDNPLFVYTDGFVIGSTSNPNNTDPTRARLKTPRLGEGIVNIKNAESAGYRVSVRMWTNAPYGTLDYDTGWLTTDDYSYDVTGKYYTIGASLLPRGADNIDINALNTSDIVITEMSTDTNNIAVVLADEVSKIKEKVFSKSLTVRSIAHRGDDIDAPKCTAPSYIVARKHGFTVAENDLWLSEDGYFVMFHDGTLAKLGNLVDINGYLMYTDGSGYYWVDPDTEAVYTWDGENYVSSSVDLSSLTRCAGSNYGVNSEQAQIGLNLDILKRIDFGLYKGEKYKGTQILTFEEWVMLCKELGMEIYVDKKMNYTTELLTQAANIVKKCGMGNYASWLGIYDIAQIELLRSIIPSSRIGILQHPNDNWIQTYSSYNTGRGFFFNGDAKTGMTASAIQKGLDAGFDVEVWFVDVPTYTDQQVFDVIRTAVSYGVTGMTLDHYKVEDSFEELLNSY